MRRRAGEGKCMMERDKEKEIGRDGEREHQTGKVVMRGGEEGKKDEGREREQIWID